MRWLLNNMIYIDMKTNQEYKNAALALLRGNWSPAVVVTIVFLVVSAVCSGPSSAADSFTFVYFVAMALAILVQLPMGAAFYASFQKLNDSADYNLLGNMFTAFKENYSRYLGAMLLTNVYIVLWALLLIIPGIIKAFSYAMTPFILNDYPELTANQAIDLSSKMMKGHKFDLFWLMLSFLGWVLLGLLTLGIGYLWLVPYMYTSLAGFYNDVKKEYTTTNI